MLKGAKFAEQYLTTKATKITKVREESRKYFFPNFAPFVVK
jgi:hypothetical protein